MGAPLCAIPATVQLDFPYKGNFIYCYITNLILFCDCSQAVPGTGMDCPTNQEEMTTNNCNYIYIYTKSNHLPNVRNKMLRVTNV